VRAQDCVQRVLPEADEAARVPGVQAGH
jgi:hypothetical protein